MRARVHERETRRDGRRRGRPPAARIHARGLADELAERHTEGTEAPETDGEADLGNRERRAPQQLLRALDAAPQKVAVRRLAEGALEAADEMRPRGVRLPREGANVERLREVAINPILRPPKMNINGDRVAHLTERLEQLLTMDAPPQEHAKRRS
jgi:hypothetical protein